VAVPPTGARRHRDADRGAPSRDGESRFGCANTKRSVARRREFDHVRCRCVSGTWRHRCYMKVRVTNQASHSIASCGDFVTGNSLGMSTGCALHQFGTGSDLNSDLAGGKLVCLP